MSGDWLHLSDYMVALICSFLAWIATIVLKKKKKSQFRRTLFIFLITFTIFWVIIHYILALQTIPAPQTI